MSFRREGISLEEWPAIHALLKSAIEHGGDTDARELIDEILNDRAQLWVKRKKGNPIAAAVTTIHPEDQTLNCQLIGGSGMENWVDGLIAHVAEQAKPLGITKFTETGRKGWVRPLMKRGWTVAGEENGKIVMELGL